MENFGTARVVWIAPDQRIIRDDSRPLLVKESPEKVAALRSLLSEDLDFYDEFTVELVKRFRTDEEDGSEVAHGSGGPSARDQGCGCR